LELPWIDHVLDLSGWAWRHYDAFLALSSREIMGKQRKVFEQVFEITGKNFYAGFFVTSVSQIGRHICHRHQMSEGMRCVAIG
jgi:hypothetical protein